MGCKVPVGDAYLVHNTDRSIAILLPNTGVRTDADSWLTKDRRLPALIIVTMMYRIRGPIRANDEKKREVYEKDASEGPGHLIVAYYTVQEGRCKAIHPWEYEPCSRESMSCFYQRRG